MNTLKNIIPMTKIGIASGFTVGFVVGCIPNTITLRFNDRKCNKVPMPFVLAIIGSACMLMSPLILTNYFVETSYVDKLIDKYDVDIERYHQYDGNNNKYAYPSLIKINISTKYIK